MVSADRVCFSETMLLRAVGQRVLSSPIWCQNGWTDFVTYLDFAHPSRFSTSATFCPLMKTSATTRSYTSRPRGIS